jgi:MOSC domain-containing protein YiiM
MSQELGRVVAIAIKSRKRGPMIEIDEAEAVVDGGIVGAPKPSVKRGITLIERDKWEAALRDAKAELPWHARRANVLVDGVDLAALIGKRVRMGDVELLIGGETKPCRQMDEIHRGLQEALRPEKRGGVYGRVLWAGSFRIGDKVEAME